MRPCDNRWGGCVCVNVKGHKKTCVCQHKVEFPWLSDRKTHKQLKEDMTYKEELAEQAAKAADILETI